MSKILVCSASVGAGHLRAAQAVELALRELAPGAEVHNVDVLTLTNAAFRQLYGKTYLDLVKRRRTCLDSSTITSTSRALPIQRGTSCASWSSGPMSRAART